MVWFLHPQQIFLHELNNKGLSSRHGYLSLSPSLHAWEKKRRGEKKNKLTVFLTRLIQYHSCKDDRQTWRPTSTPAPARPRRR